MENQLAAASAGDLARLDFQSRRRSAWVILERMEQRIELAPNCSLTPAGAKEGMEIADYSWSADGSKLLVFTNWMWNYFTYDKGNRLIIRPFVRPDEKE